MTPVPSWWFSAFLNRMDGRNGWLCLFMVEGMEWGWDMRVFVLVSCGLVLTLAYVGLSWGFWDGMRRCREFIEMRCAGLW